MEASHAHFERSTERATEGFGMACETQIVQSSRRGKIRLGMRAYILLYSRTKETRCHMLTTHGPNP